MASDEAGGDELKILPASILLTISVIAIAGLGGMPTAWGINHLSYFPRGIVAGLLGLAVASMLPVVRATVGERVSRFLGRLLEPGRTALLMRLACAAGFTILCATFRSSTQLWGDGELLASIAEEAAGGDSSMDAH